MNAFEPCPYCSHEQAQPVKFTHWGGVIGPRLMSLVKCGGCGSQFNGKSGRRVERAVKVYTWVAMGMLAVVAAWAIYSFVGPKSPSSDRTGPAQRTFPISVG